jgi:hypothetical protein
MTTFAKRSLSLSAPAQIPTKTDTTRNHTARHQAKADFTEFAEATFIWFIAGARRVRGMREAQRDGIGGERTVCARSGHCGCCKSPYSATSQKSGKQVSL